MPWVVSARSNTADLHNRSTALAYLLHRLRVFDCPLACFYIALVVPISRLAPRQELVSNLEPCFNPPLLLLPYILARYLTLNG